MYNAQNISWIGDYTVSNGSSALKVSLPSDDIMAAFQGAGNTNPDLYTRTLGKKRYEINDHLGNVRSVVSDIKLSTLSSTYVPEEFHADILAACNYYAFGMEMPGRGYSSNSYRYGFQGQELDNEIKGEGNSLNYKYRMHDPRLGRFLSIDPLASKYPFYSTYAFSGNRVIDATELEGLEPVLKGSEDNKNEFKNWMNSYSEGAEFNFDENGKIFVVGGIDKLDETKLNPFAKEMIVAVKSGQEIVYDLKDDKGDEVAPFDSFKTGSVFMEDLKKLDDNLRAAIIGQFTAERFGVPEYEKNRATIIESNEKMDAAWAVGGIAHEKILSNVTAKEISNYMSSVNRTPDGYLFVMKYESGGEIYKVQFFLETFVKKPWKNYPIFKDIKQGEIKTPKFK